MIPHPSPGNLPAGLGPFAYAFRPSPAGRFGLILIRGPAGAPLPVAGDHLTLTTTDCYDAEFKVVEVLRDGDGWQIGCERQPRPAAVEY